MPLLLSTRARPLDGLYRRCLAFFSAIPELSHGHHHGTHQKAPTASRCRHLTELRCIASSSIRAMSSSHDQLPARGLLGKRASSIMCSRLSPALDAMGRSEQFDDQQRVPPLPTLASLWFRMKLGALDGSKSGISSPAYERKIFPPG